MEVLESVVYIFNGFCTICLIIAGLYNFAMAVKPGPDLSKQDKMYHAVMCTMFYVVANL